MKDLTIYLRQIALRLNLSQPLKSRILLEIKADFEDAYNNNLTNGFDEITAVEMAKEQFLLSEKAINDLIEIHSTPLKKFFDRLSMKNRFRFERIVLFLFMLFLAFFSARLIVKFDFHHYYSPFMLPIAGIGFYVFAKALEKIFMIFVLRKHDSRNLRQGLGVIPVMTGLNVFLGAAGYFHEMYKSGGIFSNSIFSFVWTLHSRLPGSVMQNQHLLDSAIRSSGLILICLFVVIIAALIWFSLESAIRFIEVAEMSIYLEKGEAND